MGSRIFMIRTAVTLGLLGGAQARAQEAPPEVRIQELKSAGTGCTPGSVTADLTADGTTLTLSFATPLAAAAGPGQPLTRRRSNCSILVRLSAPTGWSWSITNVASYTSARLDDQVQATFRTSYSFEGGDELPAPAVETVVHGPLDGNVDAQQTIDPQQAAWSPCNLDRALIVDTEARMNRSLLGTDSGELSVHGLRLGVRWRSCNPAKGSP